MSTNLTVNGTVYAFPTNLETNWGTIVTAWAQGVSNSTLQKTGGSFTLSAEVDFGATYGLKSAYFKSRGTTLSSTGVFRMANADFLGWRDNGNTTDLELGVNTSDQLTFNGNPIVGSAALTASRALVSSAAGLVSVATTTSAEIAFVNGVTSAIQTQLNAKISASSADTLTNKSIDASANTLTNIGNSAIAAAAAIAYS